MNTVECQKHNIEEKHKQYRRQSVYDITFLTLKIGSKNMVLGIQIN